MQRGYLEYTKRSFLDDTIDREMRSILSPLLEEIAVDGSKEWLLTNGIGGYSSLPLDGRPRRKFHALLVSSLSPPLKRWVFLSNLTEKLIVERGYREIFPCVFKLFPLPTFIYNIDDKILEKTYVMPHGDNTLIVRYRSEDGIRISINPIINSRHMYDLNTGDVSFNIDREGDKIIVKPSNINKNLRIYGDILEFYGRFSWLEYTYDIDRERGEGWRDRAIDIGEIILDYGNNESYVVFTIEDKRYNPFHEFEREIERRRRLIEESNLPPSLSPLIISADSFIVKRGDHKTIIAGYHWFGDWGRDILISLPGLLLVTGRYKDAKSILMNLSEYELKGLIPNAFDEKEDKPIYNTVDASLWFIDRVYQYIKYTYDIDFLRSIWGKMRSIVENYEKGTMFDIHMDEDFMIHHGPGLTWMDARVGDRYITPRSGKAVEVQALWFNSLKIMEKLSYIVGEDGDHYHDLAKNLKNSFLNRFDNFYDVLDERNGSIRPNILFLISLDFTMIDIKRGNDIIEVIEKELLTPFGLRSLSSKDPRYKGRLIGEYNKDEAYHNGTAWPWLLGFFIKSYLRVKGYSESKRIFAFNRFIKPILPHLLEGCLGSIGEIFDGDFPYVPRGCVSQAWSVGEIIRALVEDIMYKRPDFENLIESV